ncbi:MAG: DnaJ domain-containing protein [Nitrosopumilaceae archaeon]
MNRYQSCQVLGVAEDAPFHEVKYAYRKLVLELHPDKNRSEKAAMKFKLVTEAYHYLKSEHKIQSSKPYKEGTTTPRSKEKKAPQDFNFDTGSRSWSETRKSQKPSEEDWRRYTREAEYEYQDFLRQYEKEFWQKYEGSPRQSAKTEEFQEIDEIENDLSVYVDHSFCIGCCSCETIAPTVFSVDKHTRMNPKSNVINEKGATAEKIMDAAETCPTKAINVEDRKLGKKLYPY